MRVLIVEDEAPARALLREYLAELFASRFPAGEIAGESRDGLAAVAAIGELAPDVVLLDIRMPGLDGFEVLEVLEDLPQVIFTTAYDEYAVRAFEVGAVDYLLKPFSIERLAEALERAVERLGRREHRGRGARQALGELALRMRSGRPLTRILVREGSRIHVLPVAQIDYIEAHGDYVRFHRGTEVLARQQTLGELAEGLDPGRFVRIHRSYLLNLGCLDHLERYAKDSRVAVTTTGVRLPISRAGYGRLKKLLREPPLPA